MKKNSESVVFHGRMYAYCVGESLIKLQPYSHKERFSAQFQVVKDQDGKILCELFKKIQQIGNVANALVGNAGVTHSFVTFENATTLTIVFQRNFFPL